MVSEKWPIAQCVCVGGLTGSPRHFIRKRHSATLPLPPPSTGKPIINMADQGPQELRSTNFAPWPGPNLVLSKHCGAFHNW